MEGEENQPEDYPNPSQEEQPVEPSQVQEQPVEQPQAQPASQPTQNDTAKAAPKHTHNWVEVTQVVHHDAVTHTEQVQVGSQPILAMRRICDCGADISDLHGADITTHMEQCGSWGSQILQVPVGEEPIYENRTIVDTPAYDETVVVGYRCDCGATK